jgi:hypothetical protein
MSATKHFLIERKKALEAAGLTRVNSGDLIAELVSRGYSIFPTCRVETYNGTLVINQTPQERRERDRTIADLGRFLKR